MADQVGFPSYLLAADNHNIGNSGTSWFSPDTWTDKVGSAGKFAAVSMLSGANSFYNTAAQVGNWLGAGSEQNDTAAWISSIDEDLGKYYRENKQSADLVGFVAGSLLPGLAGVKLFNMGQKALVAATDSGFIGGNLAKVMGLLTPNTQAYVTLAAADINKSLAATKLVNANTLQAIARGFWQNTLEAAAFEGVVQTTMFKSPVLEQQTVGDIVTNVAIGGLFGGVIGGSFETAKIFGQLKKTRNVEDFARFPFTARPSFAEVTSPSERIVQYAYDSEMAAVPVVLKDSTGKNIINNYAVNNTLYRDKLVKNFQDTRSNIHALSGSDTELGNVVANMSTPALDTAGNYVPGFAQNYFQNFSGAIKLARATEITAPETAVAKALKAGTQPDLAIGIRWVKNMGEDTGKITDELPVVLSLGDLYKGKGEILRKVASNKFTTKELWDASTLAPDKGYLQAEARYIWAHNNISIKDLKDGINVHANDIPLLERAYDLKQYKLTIVKGEGPSLEVFTPSSVEDLYQFIKGRKVDLANELHQEQAYKRGVQDANVNADKISKIVNVRRSYLEGEHLPNEVNDLFANQSAKEAYLASFDVRGLSKNVPEYQDPLFLPKYTKVVYEHSKDIASVKENVLDAITYYKLQQQLYEQGNKRVAVKILGESGLALPDITDRALMSSNRGGSGAGLFSAENSNYGTLGSSTAFIGSTTRESKVVARSLVGKELEAPLTRLAGNQAAAIEFESVNQKISRSGKQWIVAETSYGDRALIELKTAKANDLNAISSMDHIGNPIPRDPNIVVDFESLDEGLNYIPIRNKETLDAVESHIYSTGKRTRSWREINAQRGHTDLKDPDVFRPIRPNLRDYPHFAFVKDPKVTDAGHTTMIHAASEKEFAALAEEANKAGYKVITKTETEDFFKARGEYEYARTLNENYINSDLANKGVFSNFFPKTDPQKIVNDILQQHLRESDVLVQEAVRLRYEPQFALLEDLGKQYSKFNTSRFASRRELLERTSDNPYFNYIKTALDISKAPEHNLIYSANKILDEAVSKFTGTLTDTFKGIKSPEELDKINALLDQHGMKPAYYTAALDALANHQAPKGVLTKFVRQANSLLSLFTLGLDPLNSINNAVGSNILRMTELQHITQAIKGGNTELAGELATLAKINLPGTSSQILAPTKLVKNALETFWKEGLDGPLMQQYKKLGYIKDRAEMLKLLADDFTLQGTETVADLNSRMSAAFKKAKYIADQGEKISGNKLAEEMNRFISANVMDQITSLARAHNLMDEATAHSYINTFVNRVEGNTVASQRPLIFQGPIGQAIGLFQSYQFNLMQQLFRYVAEGEKKDIAMLLGLQSTLYGIQSLPAFQFINTHIVGQLSGNKEHRDLYDATYGVVGRTAGDFMLYGLPSNILQANLYSRGDINPRQITVLPTSLQEIPVVQGWGKFLGSIAETVGKIKGGGNIWESVLQGMEHNGVSRPLAGFAQTLQAFGPGGQVYSTSSKGSILYSNDLMSWSTIVRMAGGRPLDEAVVNDAMFRIRSYQSARSKDMQSLAETIKTTLIKGEEPSADQLNSFSSQYAALGGKQAGFNKWMLGLYKNANVPQSQQIEMNLKAPFAQKMQLLMGTNPENFGD